MEPEIICGLPFYTPSRDWRDFMEIGRLVEDLIQLKRDYNISYPDDNIINLACNIIEKLPDQQMTISEWLDKNRKK